MSDVSVCSFYHLSVGPLTHHSRFEHLRSEDNELAAHEMLFITSEPTLAMLMYYVSWVWVKQ